jgi:hypothetical protein
MLRCAFNPDGAPLVVVDFECGGHFDCCTQNGWLISLAVDQGKATIRHVSRELDRRFLDDQIDDDGDPKPKNAGHVTGVECVADPELLG